MQPEYPALLFFEFLRFMDKSTPGWRTPSVMKQLRYLPLVAFAAQMLVSPTFAAEGKAAKAKAKEGAPAEAHNLSEWHFGEVLFGSKPSDAELKGKVVVLECWGVHCPPCIASLPHLAELDKKFREKGLCIIGAESQNSSKEAIKPLLDNAKVQYAITAGANGPIAFNTIPRCFIFDGQGALVYDGYPAGAGFEKTIKDSLAKVKAGGSTEAPAVASGPLVPTRAWTNSDGREIRAAVTKVDATSVTFLMPNSKEVVYPLDKLSEDSRTALTLATQPKK